MLDLLPAELWSNPNAKFLDPVSKSGVFLREMAKRLMHGLSDVYPDVQERVNHIFSEQLYGIAITELTSLISRRSVYCTKTANNPYSVCNVFTSEDGNIKYTPMKHSWENGRCKFCGASQDVYDRDNGMETYAYQFIHTNNPEKIFNMKFDVIIGNPPYQLNDGGGAGKSAIPLYHRFIIQAKKLKPRFLSMIIPARWYAGGKGLDQFRDEMIHDDQIKTLVDYFDSQECFPGVDLSGGICYFLWQKDYHGPCTVRSILNGEENTMVRSLVERGGDSFIRFNEAIKILHKVQAGHTYLSFADYVSSRKPFGLDSKVCIHNEPKDDYVRIFAYPNNGYIKENNIEKNSEWLDCYKVYLTHAYGERGDFPYLVTGKPFIGEPGTCCSETYLLIGPFKDKQQCDNVISYMKTKFFRFFVLLKKNTQNASKGVFQYVPLQNFNESWNDEKLYKKYNLEGDEIEFIESMIRPME